MNPTLSNRTTRLLLGVGIPVGTAVVALGPIVWWGHRLPRRLASHWNGLGPADGFTSRTAMYAIIVAALATGSAVLATTAARRRITVSAGVGSGVAGGLLCGFAAAMSIATVGANRQATQSSTPPSLSLLPLVSSFVALFGVAIATGLLASSLAGGEALPAAAAPISTHPGERVAWTGTSRPRPVLLTVAAVGIAVPIVFGLATGRWGSTVISIVLLGASLLMTGTRVTVGPAGMLASMGVLGVPRVNLPLEHIVQASALEIRPSKWGGWGYRGSLTILRRAAMVLRAGEGIRVDLIGGRVFVVSVDDAEAGASVLQAAIAARPSATTA